MNKNTYSTYKRDSLFDKATYSARMKIYNALTSEIPVEKLNSIVDVGVTADRTQGYSNFFEKLYPYSDRITALSDQDASWMEDVYQGLKFVRGSGLNMPFEDDSFDLVFSSAVVEHVGSRKNQRQFIRECLRVSKKYVFITTPNRWYPVELHTALPFLHWFPPRVYRTILSHIGKNFFAQEENLNLLSKKDLVNIINSIEHARFRIRYIRFFGFKSNLLLLIRK